MSKVPRHPHEIDPLAIPAQDELTKWFYNCLIRQELMSQENWSPFGNYYEFGVGFGGTMTRYLRALNRFCVEYDRDPSQFYIFGFDSFEGLPESSQNEDQHPLWYKGAFSHSVEEIQELIENLNLDVEFPNINFIKGVYEKSLTASLRDKLISHPPSIVTIDVDYYSSTKPILDWLKPILKSGTLFYFDDIWSFHGNPRYGELKAINEFNESGWGFLTSCPLMGMPTYSYIYCNYEFEYKFDTTSYTKYSKKVYETKFSNEIRKLVDSKNFKEVVNLLSSLPIENNDAEKQYYLALSLHSLGDNDKDALTRYDLALKYGYKPFWVYYNRGSLLYKLNETEKAYQDLKQAFELDPQHEGIKVMWDLVNNVSQKSDDSL